MISALRHEVVLPGGLVEEAIISEPDYLVIRQDCGEFQLLQGNSASEDYPGQKEVVAAVGSLAHHRIASESEELYIHSGVVAIRGQAILFPGASFSGKSTLVKALVDAGAEYFSDEYAILSFEDSLVRAFPRSIRLRHPQRMSVRTSKSGQILVASMGAVFFLKYQKTSTYDVTRLSSGQAAMLLFSNTVAGDRFGEKALSRIANLTVGAPCWSGFRGEADDAAARIIQLCS